MHVKFRITVFRVLAFSLLAVAKPVAVNAQVIILPTSKTFSVSTSVSVPDGGSIGLGGVRYGALGRTSSGVSGMGILPLFGVSPFFNHRATSQALGSSQASLNARIIDFRSLDQQVFELGQRMVSARQAAGITLPPEKELPSRIPAALRNSFPSSR